MTDEVYLMLRESGLYNKQARMLLGLNDLYHKYLYIDSIKSIENEKKKLLNEFKHKK
jgi:hypothetical protein